MSLFNLPRFQWRKTDLLIVLQKESAGIHTCYSSRDSRPSHCPVVRTSNAEAHADMKRHHTFPIRENMLPDINISRRHLPLLYSLTTKSCEVFESQRTKRQVNAFPIYVIPPTPPVFTNTELGVAGIGKGKNFLQNKQT